MTISSALQFSPVLTQIAVGYQNSGFLFDELFPPIITDTEAFRYVEHAATAAFDVYNDRSDQDSDVPAVKSSSSLVSGLTLDYSLREAVNALVEQASGQVGFSQKARTTRKLLGHQALNREIRLATELTTDSNFPSANILTAGAGASPAKWDQTSATPIKDCLSMIDLLPTVPGGRRIGIFSLPAWRALSVHVTVTNAFQYVMVGGVVAPESMLPVLGLDEIRIMRAQYQTGLPNGAASALSLTRLMGDDVAFIVEPGASTGGDMEMPAWAYNFRLRVKGQTLPVYTYEAPQRGGHGSTWVQVACNEVFIVVGEPYGARIKDTTT